MASFRGMVSGLKTGMTRQYDRGVNRDLSQQRYEHVFKRNVTMVLREIYQQALAELQQLAFDKKCLESEKNKDQGTDLSSELLQSFDGVIEELILYALQKHRGSCALSNFPAEHNPSKDYISDVIEGVSQDWSAFARQVNIAVAS